VKRFVAAGITAAALFSTGHTKGSALEKLQLQVSPAVSMAPASVMVRTIIAPDAENRQLEIVADSENFYRRSVVDLDGETAPKVNELRLLDIPGGEYEVTASLYDSRGGRSTVRRTIMVTSVGRP